MIEVNDLIELALREDIGDGDITTSSLIKTPLKGVAHLLAKERLILAGTDIFRQVYRKLDPDIEFRAHFKDGDEIDQDSIIGEISGKVETILKGERVALNNTTF